MFISLEGIDGSGKTSTAQALSEIYDYDFVVKKKIEHPDAFIMSQYDKIRSANYPSEHGEDDHLMSTDYWLYLQCVWYTLIYDLRVRPSLAEGKTVIVDGWFYKFKSKIRFEIEDEDAIDKVFTRVPQPQLVVMLDTDPSIALSRRPVFAHCEAGSHSGRAVNDANFILFQNDIRDGLLTQEKETWEKLTISANWSINEVAAEVNKLINNYKNLF